MARTGSGKLVNMDNEEFRKKNTTTMTEEIPLSWPNDVFSKRV